jgi:hypothetical protein
VDMRYILWLSMCQVPGLTDRRQIEWLTVCQVLEINGQKVYIMVDSVSGTRVWWTKGI